MGGREATRGFVIQTLICLLDGLESDAKWVAVTIEPDSEHEKVDLLWEYPDGKRAVQVKSSKNPMGRADIAKWCADLRMESAADSYELRLAGPISSGALTAHDHDEVNVPPPSSILVRDLLEQAITKLDRYLTSAGIEPVPLVIRMSLVDICAAKLIVGSITGIRVEREDFNGWLLRWITAAYPGALSARLSANCEILWDSLDLSSPEIGKAAFQISTPLSIYNSGGAVAIVEWLLIHVRSKERRMLYSASRVVQAGKLVAFSSFAVGAGQAHNIQVVYSPIQKAGFETDSWPLGEHELELVVKYSNDQTPRTVKTMQVAVTGDHMGLLNRAGVITILITTLGSYLNDL